MTRRWTDKDGLRYLELRKQGFKQKQIAREMGFTRECLRLKARLLELPIFNRGGKARSVARDEQLMNDLNNGATIQDVADRYRITRQRVYQIKKKYEDG